ncbi:MAG: twin-arginine translocation pathway signal protein, partial [Betaproteobacteria bacterium]
NLAHRNPELFNLLREEWLAWNKTVPAIPEDATVSLGYSQKDMPQR